MSAPSVSKTVRSLQRLGLKVTEVCIGPDGAVRVLTANDDSVDDSLAAMRRDRHARKAGRLAQSH